VAALVVVVGIGYFAARLVPTFQPSAPSVTPTWSPASSPSPTSTPSYTPTPTFTPSPTPTITPTPSEDTNPPQIHSIVYERKLKPGDLALIKFNVTDDSGIKEARLMVTGPDNMTKELLPEMENGLYVFKFPLTKEPAYGFKEKTLLFSLLSLD